MPIKDFVLISRQQGHRFSLARVSDCFLDCSEVTGSSSHAPLTAASNLSLHSAEICSLQVLPVRREVPLPNGETEASTGQEKNQICKTLGAVVLGSGKDQAAAELGGRAVDSQTVE